MRSFFKKEPGLTRVIVLLAVLALVILGLDIWEVATGNVDLNRHIPFFLPLALVAFAAIAWRIRAHFLAMPPSDRKRLVQEAERRSYLHPDNLPKSRTRPDSIE